MSKELSVGTWALFSGIALVKVAVVASVAVVGVAAASTVYVYALDRYERKKKGGVV